MKLYLRTLSPLHIGTGEELTPLDYVVYQDTFYRISQDQLFALTRQLVPQDGPRKLGDWVGEQVSAMNDARDNFALSQLNNDMNAYQFFHSQGKGREFLQALKAAPFSENASPVVIDRKTRERYRNATVVPLGQVRGGIKNGQGRPYLPGSSLKGSLRTALMFHDLMSQGDKSQLEKLVHEQLSRRAKKERFALPLVHDVFFCGAKGQDKERVDFDDEKMDLLKLVRITDARLSKTNKPLQLGKINIYLVEKKPSKDTRSKAEFEASQQPQASYCEMIPKGQILETELDFDIEFLYQIKGHLKDGAIRAGGQLQWIGIEKKVKRLFGLDLAALNEGNKEEMKAAVLQHILQCWAAFSRRQIAAQRQWLAHYRKNDQRDRFSTRIEQGMEPVFAKEKGDLIHLGYATGFQGMTALLYFLEDKRLEALYKRVLETFGIGNKPGNRGEYKVNMERFPKSRRLIEDGEKIRPMGWLELVDANAEAVWEDDSAAVTSKTSPQAPAVPEKPAEPAFFKGTLNFKKPPEFDAVVTKSGRPNTVKVWITPDYMPEMPLMGYASPLDEGAVIVVRSEMNKKGELVQVSFGRRK